MPRRNHNARPIYRPKDEMTKIFVDRPMWLDVKKPTGIKITGESIVREYRRNWDGGNEGPPNRHDTPVYNVSPPPRPHFSTRPSDIIRRFFCAINWNVAMEWTCWAAVIGCLIYLGVFVFAPFGMKLWR